MYIYIYIERERERYRERERERERSASSAGFIWGLDYNFANYTFRTNCIELQDNKH